MDQGKAKYHLELTRWEMSAIDVGISSAYTEGYRGEALKSLGDKVLSALREHNNNEEAPKATGFEIPPLYMETKL